MASAPLATCLLLFLGASLVLCADICTPSTAASADIPETFSSDFAVGIESVDRRSKTVDYITAFYSQSKGLIRLNKNTYNDGQSQVFLNFNTKQKLVFSGTTSDHKCVVTDLSNSDPDVFFVGGMKNDGINSGKAFFHLEGQSGFGSDIVLSKTDVGKTRGMATTRFTSCQKWTLPRGTIVSNTTTDVSPTSWTSTIKSGMIPLKMETHATFDNGTNEDHYYNYFNFRSTLPDDAFHMPEGYVCTGMKSTVPFPDVPPYISFSQETVSNGNKLAYVNLIFDTLRNYAATFTYSGYSMNDGVVEYRDYMSGLSYTRALDRFNCSVKNISDVNKEPSRAYLDETNAEGKVTQLTPKQLYDDGTGADYIYMGEKVVRGVTTDSWVTQYTLQNTQLTVEWYFAKASLSTWNANTDLERSKSYRIPFMRRMWIPGYDNPWENNIYDVELATPNIDMIDIASCYPDSEVNLVHFTLYLNGQKANNVASDINKSKWKTITKFSNDLNVEMLRFSEIKYTFYSDRLEVTMFLLHPPPFASDRTMVKTYRPTANIIKDFRTRIQSKNLFIVTANNTQYPIDSFNTAIGKSKAAARKALPRPSVDGYSAGAMAGLGIAMAAIGIGGGGFVSYRFINV